jgi:hypothetical protein
MEGLYYLAFIIAVFIAIQWYIGNEGGDGYKGLLAMRRPGAREADALARKKGKRRSYHPPEPDDSSLSSQP